MRLRNTMLHSGNLKAVLTTNLQPPIPPPYVPPSAPYPPSASPNTRSFDTHSTPRLPTAPSCHPQFPSLLSHSFALTLPPIPLRKSPFVTVSSTVHREWRSSSLRPSEASEATLAEDTYFRDAKLERRWKYRWKRSHHILGFPNYGNKNTSNGVFLFR